MAFGDPLPEELAEPAARFEIELALERNAAFRDEIVVPLWRLKARAPRDALLSVAPGGVVSLFPGIGDGDFPEPPDIPDIGFGAGGAVVGRRTVNFHLTGDTPAGVASQEVRVYGPIARPFRVAQVTIYPLGAPSVGQFVDVLVSDDGATGDVVSVTGRSIFSLVEAASSQPAPDGDRGVAVPDRPIALVGAAAVNDSGRWVKVRSYFVAPAVSLPDLHVVVVLEELSEGEAAPGAAPPAPPPEEPAAVAAAPRPRRTRPPEAESPPPPPQRRQPEPPEPRRKRRGPLGSGTTTGAARRRR